MQRRRRRALDVKGANIRLVRVYDIRSGSTVNARREREREERREAKSIKILKPMLVQGSYDRVFLNLPTKTRDRHSIASLLNV